MCAPFRCPDPCPRCIAAEKRAEQADRSAPPKQRRSKADAEEAT